MKFYEWLKTINPKEEWSQDFDILEKQLIENIQECGYINLLEIMRQFYLNSASGYPDGQFPYRKTSVL